ncbi:MAG: FAD-dependent oxidoreductase [Pseudomonadota bacterium]
MKREKTAVEEAREAANASDPYAREQQTFPVLTKDQVDRLSTYGVVERIPKGTWLFERGERGVDFFLIVDGSIEIVDKAPDGEETVITIHARHQFTGELDLFNQRKILVGGRTGEDSCIVRMSRAQFHRMASTEQDIGEIIMRAFILRRTAFIVHSEAGVSLIGESNDRDVIRINRFLTRNGYPLSIIEPTAPQAISIVQENDGHLPLVCTPDGGVFHNPSTPDLADLLGLTEELPSDHLYDLAIIGAGPSGLSACVYAASEALDTIVIEAEAPGGQAGTSSKIENYLGFPTGISGQALAGRAWIQGQKFGATFAIARGATGIAKNPEGYFDVSLQGGQGVKSKAVILACGAIYRRLNLKNYDEFEGQGIHYAATALEARFCSGSEIVVVGGGNSAGQAAVFLSNHAQHVHVLIRGDSLAASMSDYLIQRIDQSSRITLHRHTQLTGLHGDRKLQKVTWENRATKESETRAISNVFVMIGATPNTHWLGDLLEMDQQGFIHTGGLVRNGAASPFGTSVEGVFAVGDVRSGSVKRVASGVGEGSVCVSDVHRFLALSREDR